MNVDPAEWFAGMAVVSFAAMGFEIGVAFLMRLPREGAAERAD